MEPDKLKLEQRLSIDPQAVMSSFCWAYTNALLNKLRSLDEKDELFRDGGNRALYEENDRHNPATLTEVGYSVVSVLVEQISWKSILGVQSVFPSEIGELISGCQEFLDIFVQGEGGAPQGESLEECINFVRAFLHDPPMVPEREAAQQLVLVLHARFGFIPKASK